MSKPSRDKILPLDRPEPGSEDRSVSRPRRSRLTLEPLENRLLLSADPFGALPTNPLDRPEEPAALVLQLDASHAGAHDDPYAGWPLDMANAARQADPHCGVPEPSAAAPRQLIHCHRDQPASQPASARARLTAHSDN